MIKKDVEMKADWYRVKKKKGFSATNIKISSNRNPVVDVDPFGPPLLTKLATQPQQQPLALTDGENNSGNSNETNSKPKKKQQSSDWRSPKPARKKRRYPRTYY